eukprot:CAMPEP_0168511828 /NCGR_PEP_ID=MMETSP0405-20121227/2395_1 /TAXON_ID=498012 /ORGANISM="Trichosphaerium sp, Strain Am-I-7 wt" /LENGTH=327 /DNA_ID=CAMNT_0008530135 /DNA_START=272 /DNA_END=1255 /DNA_ORIENTATION=+
MYTNTDDLGSSGGSSIPNSPPLRFGDFGSEEREMLAQRLCEVKSEMQNIPAFHEPIAISNPSGSLANLRFSPDPRGYTPLHYTSALGKNTSTSVLLEDRRVNVDAREPREGFTPLMFSVVNHQVESITTLIEQGANPNLKDFTGRTPLYLATQLAFTDVVKYLVENSADPNQADLDGVTPLHAAAALGNMKCIEILIRNGAWIDARDNQGETPLFFALREGQHEVVKALISCGANVSIENSDGETPIDFSEDIGDNAMFSFLSSVNSSKAPGVMLVEGDSFATVCPPPNSGRDFDSLANGIGKMSVEYAAPPSPLESRNLLNKWVMW